MEFIVRSIAKASLVGLLPQPFHPNDYVIIRSALRKYGIHITFPSQEENGKLTVPRNFVLSMTDTGFYPIRCPFRNIGLILALWNPQSGGLVVNFDVLAIIASFG